MSGDDQEPTEETPSTPAPAAETPDTPRPVERADADDAAVREQTAKAGATTLEPTAAPPDVNPAGLPVKEPFPLAHSPAPPTTEKPTQESEPEEPIAETLESPWPHTPAASLLSGAGELETWHSRAELLESEALATTSPAHQAQGLVAASECWALLGDHSRAHQLVQRALELSPALEAAHLQARQIAVALENWGGMLHGLEMQARTGATDAARLHALHYAADLCRLKLDKLEQSKRHRHSAAEIGPEDARASLAALIDGLLRSNTAPRAVLSQQKWASALEPARQELKALREPQSTAELGASPAVLFRSIQQALAERRPDRSARLVADLASADELKHPALWLASALSAPSRDTRDLAIECLKELLVSESTEDARNALVARALEQGSAEALRVALEADCGGARLNPLHQLALHALAGDVAATSKMEALAQDAHSGRPLMGALRAALDAEADLGETVAAGAPLFSVARAAGNGAAYAELVAKLMDGVDGAVSPSLSPLLRIEAATASGNATELAAALESWPQFADDHTESAHFVMGLLRDLSGERAAAQAHLDTALADATLAPAAADALLRLGEGTEILRALERLAESAPSAAEAALYRVHASYVANRLQDPRAQSLLESAASNAEGLPFAGILGEQIARKAQDAEETAAWLSRLREQAEPSVERPLLSFREAATLAPSNSTTCALLLEDGATAAPQDVASRLVHESLVQASPGERATWREELAEASDDSDLRRILYAEAAMLYEQAGEHEDAQRAALLLAELPDASTTREVSLYSSLVKRHEVEPEPSRGTRNTLPPPEELAADPNGFYALGVAQYLERQALDSGDLEKLLAVSDDLAVRLDPADAVGPAFFSTVGRLGQVPADHALTWLRRILTLESPPVWALRYTLELGKKAGEHDAVLRAVSLLYRGELSNADRAALAYQGAQAAIALGSKETAIEWLEHVVRNAPRHVGALELLAQLQDEAGEFRRAADTLVELAAATTRQPKQIDSLLQAATLLEGRLKDADGARSALEKAVKLDVCNPQVFERLVRLYQAAPAPLELVSLYQSRIEAETDPDARRYWEEQRASALGTSTNADAMQAKLESRLKAAPDDPRALEGAASLALARGDTTSAEQLWIRLAKLTPGEPLQVKAYERLAHLYENVLKNPERAVACYRELAEASPTSLAGWTRLVQACLQSGNVVEALKAQTSLVNNAMDPDTKRLEVLRLASMYETHAQDARRAEASLLKARKAWPFATDALEALFRLYGRTGAPEKGRTLLQAARVDILRGIVSGSFESEGIRALATIARLRNERDAERVYDDVFAAVAGVQENAEAPPPLGERALTKVVQDLVSPATYSPSLRRFLERIDDTLQGAFPPAELRAEPEPLKDNALFLRIRAIARAFGVVGEPAVATARDLPSPCVVRRGAPTTILLTPKVLDSASSLQDYLVVRAFVIAGLTPLSDERLPDERGVAALVVALLHYGAAVGQHNVAQELIVEMGNALAERLPAADDELTTVAQEAAAALQGQLRKVVPQLCQVADRTALLWTGSLRTAVEATAVATPVPPLPPEGDDRLQWILEHPACADLLRFAVSDAYAKLRSA